MAAIRQHLNLGNLLSYVFLIVTSLIMIYPLIYIFLGSLMSLEEYVQISTFIPLPSNPNFLIYRDTWLDLSHSILITISRVTWYSAIGVLVSLFGGYAFSRLQFPGKNFIFMFFLAGLFIPPILMSLPHYVMLARFPLVGGNDLVGQGGSGFIDTLPSLMLLGAVDVFAMFLVKQSYDMLPIEYEEAAKIDGAGLLTIIFRIYFPLLRPAMIAVFVIIFVVIWNDYFMPLLLVGGNNDLKPVAVRVQQSIYAMTFGDGFLETPYPRLFASALIAGLPPILMYLLFQRFFVQGLANTGIKG